ncbi:hypothetical protein QQF64_003780 [Cirrhinus molitorella]|uniref:Uncharacterized protein n=1 Tax=Cirrhinus molitorella TaxID=172907 RepID=A0ABR3MM89_9TELE
MAARRRGTARIFQADSLKDVNLSFLFRQHQEHALFSSNCSHHILMAETKIIYHIDEEETPYLVKLSVAPEKGANEAVIAAAMICHHWHLPVSGDDDCIISSFVGSASEWATVMLVAVQYAIAQHTVHLFAS